MTGEEAYCPFGDMAIRLRDRGSEQLFRSFVVLVRERGEIRRGVGLGERSHTYIQSFLHTHVHSGDRHTSKGFGVHGIDSAGNTDRGSC